MSTTSILYHGFGLGVTDCTNIEYSDGQIRFHVKRPDNRVGCSVCRSQNIIHRGRRLRNLRTLPIGKKACWIRVTICMQLGSYPFRNFILFTSSLLL